ncbi:sialate O-acetylesterase [Tengunoibacter tsumagoiensis]|uniref:Sialate O-acetylesterase domain-containing protein n=1 Tax=Tengunoibacter tsumagoiensis TaxID=2014871 RepID=A0A402A132_9CHLR|nr:sialate O-acetylesterase [Tengunoibacter tsumagoiensis]GCE12870.1 hypothetical protein KTT_27290 [Tengunoibacter tsumagoiensis]
MAYQNIQSYQVLQRDEDNKARVQLANGQIQEFAVGGPYTIGEAHDVLVGDIWILAGQSNMEGVGDLIDVEEPSPFVHSFQSREEWAVAEEPLHWLGESPRIVHRLIWGQDIHSIPTPFEPRDPHRTKGSGLGLTFAKERYARTGVPIGLIPCAHGGTSMSQWDPALKGEGDRSLYGATMQRVTAVGGKVTGILWYQGESDANPTDAALYADRMHVLIKAFREDLGNADLPFYLVQLGRFTNDGDLAGISSWNLIRTLQLTQVATLPHTGLAAAIDLELDDFIHIGVKGLKRLGKRLADVADGYRIPTIVSLQREGDGSLLRLTYQDVRGGLHAPGLPAGFSIRNAQGKDLFLIYKITLEGNTVLLHLGTNTLPEDSVLWYGWGMDPYCNITDAADTAIPVVGPLSLA